jgi:hypothetical protein
MTARLKTFQEVLDAAVEDILQHGFDSGERIAKWTRELRIAAEASMISAVALEQQLREGLATIYRRLVERGGIAKYHQGVERFTLEKVRPQLRAELDRRIVASSDLIKLNRAESIEKTLRRFQGWSTSIPPGGVSAEGRREVKQNVKKALASLPYEERRVVIDQSAKLIASINDLVATDGGAIAGMWRSMWRQAGYDARPEHKARDEQIYLVRDSWAHRAGLVKKNSRPFVDEIEAPAQLPFCFPGDSQIPFADNVEKAYRRWYSGDLTTIITASGKTLRATPNHPILTSHGWVQIGALNEGDDMIEISDNIVRSVNSETNQNKTVTCIAEIFATLNKFGVIERIGGSCKQFHGDGTASDVDVVGTAWPLRFGFNPMRLQGLHHFSFSVADLCRTAAGAVKFFLQTSFSAGARFMCCLNQFAPTIFAFAGHTDQVCFGAIPQRNIEMVGKRTARNTQSFGQTQETFPFEVRATRIIKIERRQWSGHVYNLQTESGWFVADGIIVHNCRCSYRFLYALRDLPDDMLTAKGKAWLANARIVSAARADDAASGLDLVHSEIFRKALRRDALGYFVGVTDVRFVDDRDAWHASYESDDDSVEIQRKFDQLPAMDRVQILLHEAGHRGQEIDPGTYAEFKRRHLNKIGSFLEMANRIHLDDLRRRGKVDSVASEVFAESYARFMLKLPLPAELAQFWEERMTIRPAVGIEAERRRLMRRLEAIG